MYFSHVEIWLIRALLIKGVGEIYIFFFGGGGDMLVKGNGCKYYVKFGFAPESKLIR